MKQARKRKFTQISLWFSTAALGPGGYTHTQPLSALHVHTQHVGASMKDLFISKGWDIPMQSMESQHRLAHLGMK